MRIRNVIFSILALTSASFAQTPLALLPPPYICFYDGNGNPLSGGFVYSYAAGTNTPQNTFTDSTGAVANTNPVTLDSAGCSVIWIGSNAYDIEVRDSGNNLFRRTNNVTDVGQVLFSQVVLISPSGQAQQTILGPLESAWFFCLTLHYTSPCFRIKFL